MKLFIDDERRTPPGFTHDSRTVEWAIYQLKKAKDNEEPLELVSFDYDAHAYLNWTFEPVAEWIKDNDYWPWEIRIHTLNSWKGRPWFEKFFTLHAPATTIVDHTNPHVVGLNQPEWANEFRKAQARKK